MFLAMVFDLHLGLSSQLHNHLGYRLNWIFIIVLHLALTQNKYLIDAFD